MYFGCLLWCVLVRAPGSHGGYFFFQLPLEVGTTSQESFNMFPSLDLENFNSQGSPFDEDPMSDGSQYQPCSDSWDDFQALSPFGLDWEMEQEFFKSDNNDFGCKTQGPTLAELNNQRSTSPLINPEMERLHRIATRSDSERPSTGTSSSCDIKIRINGPENTDLIKEKAFSSTRTGNRNYHGGENFQKGLNSEKCGAIEQESIVSSGTNVSSTPKIKQEPTETIELKHSDLMKKIAYLEAKSNNQNPNIVPNNSTGYSDLTVPTNHRRTSSESSSIEDDHLAVIREESADEELDSDDDYYDDSHARDSLEVPAKQRKGRRGDLEDMNPNPRKLLEISRELNRLTKIITDLKPIHSLPITARNKSKKEKNKLASRFVFKFFFDIVQVFFLLLCNFSCTRVGHNRKLNLMGIMLFT